MTDYRLTQHLLGKPSQKLISRIRKERNSKLSSNSSDNAELLSRLNFAGQSPQQIRERLVSCHALSPYFN